MVSNQKMRDKAANFGVGQNRRFWKQDTTGDIEIGTKPPIDL